MKLRGLMPAVSCSEILSPAAGRGECIRARKEAISALSIIIMKISRIILAVFLLLCLFSNLSLAEESKTITLLKPRMDKGKTLMQSLESRKTSREFKSDEIPIQVLSEILWAACGINRPESGKRTAPSAHNIQEVKVYVAKADGLFVYDPLKHALIQILKEDIRAATGKQPFVKDAPVNLIFVADYAKMGDASLEDKDFYAALDTGFISENVYLYCAAMDLATVARGWFDRPALSKAMKLRDSQKAILTQTVGNPE